VSDSFSAKIAALLAATDKASTPKARGDILEKLAAHVLGSISGVEVSATNAHDVHRSEEVDLVLLNRQRPDGLDLFANFILVECKNWKEPLGSQGVAAFARKLQLRGMGLGILVSRRGITGDMPDLTAAQQVLSDELKEGREILVVREADLSRLKNPADVVKLLLVRRSNLMISRGFVEDDGWFVESSSAGSFEPDVPHPGTEGRKGWKGVRLAIREEEEKVCAAMLKRVPSLPDTDADQLLVDRNNALHQEIAKAAGGDGLGAWKDALDAMLDLGATAIAFFHRSGGWEQKPADLVSSTALYSPNVRHIAWDSRLFVDLATYYSLEISNEEDLDARTATLSLLGMMLESHWRLEEGLYEAMADELH
jgi:hypothetical protein